MTVVLASAEMVFDGISLGSSYATALYTQPWFTLRVLGLSHPLLAEASNLESKHYSSLPLSWAHLSAGLVYSVMSDVSSKCC